MTDDGSFMRPPLRVPTQSDIHAYPNQWITYFEALSEQMQHYKDFDFKKMLLHEVSEEEADALFATHGCNMDRLTAALARDADNWEDRATTEDDIDSLRCDENECWYQGNLDRRREYGSAMELKGSQGAVVLCDVCFQNFGKETVAEQAERRLYESGRTAARELSKETKRADLEAALTQKLRVNAAELASIYCITSEDLNKLYRSQKRKLSE